MNTTEILQGLKKPECTCNHIHCTYRAHNAAIDAAIAALEKAMLEKAGKK